MLGLPDDPQEFQQALVPGLAAILSDLAPSPGWQKLQQESSQGMPPEIPGMVASPEVVIEKLTNDKIIQQHSSDVDESSTARQERENEWRVSADLYNNYGDDSGKAAWQARVFVPQIYNKIQMAKSLVKASLLENPRWFSLEQLPAWSADTANVKFVEHVLGVVLESADFVEEYMKCLEEGFLYGTGCIKLTWEQWVERSPEMIEVPLYEDPQQMQMAQMMGQPTTRPLISSAPHPRSSLRAYQVPIWNIYPDPFHEDYRRGRYIIEELMVDQEEIEDGIRLGRYNCLDDIKDIGEPASTTYEFERRQREGRQTSLGRRGPRKQHLLQIRYGNFYDDDGAMLVENWVSIVANKKKVIALDSNPSMTGSRPYILSTPLPMRGSPWGREIIYAAKPLQIVLNSIYNLMIDSTTYGVIPACTVNKNKLDPDEDFDALTPGAVYHVTGDGAIQPLKIATTPNEAMPMIQSFEAKIDESTMMYGTLAGEPPLKGRATATQYRGEVSQGRAAASILAHGLEKRDLEPAVQLAYENILQYLSDISEPRLQEAFSTFMGPSTFLDEWNRYKLLNTKFQVRARGLSMQLEREEQLQKLMQLSTTAQMLQLPFDIQAKIFFRSAEAMNIDPRELNAPADEAGWQAFTQQMMAQQQATGGGQQGGASAASPEPPSSPPAPPGPPNQATLGNQVTAMSGPPAAGG